MKRAVLMGLVAFLAATAGAQQIAVPRVEAMPSLPATYALRDWKSVARGFDSLAFDATRQGTHLPLVRLYESGPNYPQQGGFGLHTYVGTGSPQGNEAIAALPALVGATLVGVDKRDQFGQDWVLRAMQYFNNRPSEYVYLNAPVATSGQDWWYDTMPNVFFYQLYNLYGGVGDFERQFGLVAGRWHQALVAMGGSTAPWRAPQMNYRAFALSTMEPLRTGVVEPEAAGALAWIQYMAFRQTGDRRYRVGAEWAMEFLNSRTTNPSYELQLPYGALAAARMNAELGTRYDVEKLVNWTFEQGPLRGWGAVVGTWGGYNADGLIGEVAGTDYAFVLNGFQQAAALVPLVRYDPRFARTVGRWMINLASASRLFYHPFLPDANQDGESWARQYDPQGFIPYEALRERENGIAPFATGDAVRGGWAATNLSLYSGASVGYLAALVDTTEVRGVIRLDLRATDFFGDGYDTYLYYNGTLNGETVLLPLPAGAFDLYDPARDRFLARGATGSFPLDVTPDDALVVVLVPAGRVQEEKEGKLFIGGVPVDFSLGSTPAGPRVKAFAADRQTLGKAETARLYCTGDAAGALTYTFMASGGTFGTSGTLGASRVITWQSAEPGVFEVACEVESAQGLQARDTLRIEVLSNLPPRVTAVTATPDIVEPGAPVALACSAADPEGDALTYTWRAETGSVESSDTVAVWTAPSLDGYYGVLCRVHDPSGAADSSQAFVTVGSLVAHLRLDGDAADASHFANSGQRNGTSSVPGVMGAPNTALRFDGIDDHVALASEGWLNPRRALTVAFWARADAVGGREQFLASHGSWQHRWKVSITPQGALRWTVNTEAGIVDLDAPGLFPPETFVHVAAAFDGQAMRLYANGTLAAQKPHTGLMAAVTFDLLLGQMLPGQTDYNFKGTLDDFRLYNRALSPAEVAGLYALATSKGEEAGAVGLSLGAAFPNPSVGSVQVPFTVQKGERVRLVVYDALGRQVRVLHSGPLAPGAHTAVWDGVAADGQPAGAGVYVVVLESGGSFLRTLVVRLP